MEEKKSIVTSSILKRQGIGKDGKPYFIHIVSFQNGDTGELFSRQNPQNDFQIGKEHEYTKEIKTNGQYTNVAINAKKERTGGFKGQNPIGMNKRCALENAVALAVVGKIQVEKIKEYSENFNKWLNE